MNKITNKKVEANWSGSYPCLCQGEWSLKVYGKDVSNKIPKTLKNSPMNTLGEYSEWRFKNWMEVWETFTDGLDCDEWIRKNKKWLDRIDKTESVQKEIFKAISEKDFRLGSCGGCI